MFRKESDFRSQGSVREELLSHVSYPLNPSSGYTVLELLITIGIITVLLTLGSVSMSGAEKKRIYQQSYQKLLTEINILRGDVFLRNAAGRINVAVASDSMTITRSMANGSVASCSSGSWTQISTVTLDLHEDVTVSGTGLGNECFFADGTASAASYDFDLEDGDDDLSTTLTITAATGFVDVVYD